MVGADVARGVAVLGMFTAHVGDVPTDFWTPTGWLQVTDGRSAATFALLAGLSAALLSGGPRPVEGRDLRHARVRILTRAVALWPLGMLLTLLGTPVAVILQGYAVMFALVTVALRWRPRTLVLTAAAVAVGGSVVVVLARDALLRPLPARPLVELFVGHYYPAAVWMAYLLVGLAVGRTDLLAAGAARRLLAWGVPCAVVGYGVAAVAVRVIEPEHTLRRALLSAFPHANTAPEVLGNVGVSLCLLAVCLVLARHAGRWVAPVAATGALALTAYCTHIVVIALLGDGVVWSPSNGTLLLFVAVTLVLTTLWRRHLGRGPLERGLHALSTVMADAVVPRDPSPAGGPPDPSRTGGALRPEGSHPGEQLPVENGEPAVGRLAPGAPRIGQQLQGDVVGEAVGDRLLGER